MIKLIFATQNIHKVQEINNILGKDFNILNLTEMGCLEELPETQNTFEGNALQKAQFVFDKFNQNCFADDSGLEIVALDNKPGIFSARYAGIEKNMDANINKILEEMNGIPNREAQFRTVIALIINGKNFIFNGIIKGTIINEKRGSNGFGYDPIFIPDGHLQTFAEMPLDQKNKISHRAIAIQKLKNFFIKQ